MSEDFFKVHKIENVTVKDLAMAEKTEGTGMINSVMCQKSSEDLITGGYQKIGALITTERLSEILGVTTQVIRKLCKDRKIPHYKLERSFRFNLTEVLESLRVR